MKMAKMIVIPEASMIGQAKKPPSSTDIEKSAQDGIREASMIGQVEQPLPSYDIERSIGDVTPEASMIINFWSPIWSSSKTNFDY